MALQDCLKPLQRAIGFPRLPHYCCPFRRGVYLAPLGGPFTDREGTRDLSIAAAEVGSYDTVDQNWRAHATCAQMDPELFFAAGAIEHKVAKRVCRSCPVRSECLAYAMEAPVDHGIWGGLTERERRRFRRRSGSDWREGLAQGA